MNWKSICFNNTRDEVPVVHGIVRDNLEDGLLEELCVPSPWRGIVRYLDLGVVLRG